MVGTELKHRHQRPQYDFYFLLAVIQFVGFFYFVPMFGKAYWPAFLDFMDANGITKC